MIWGIYPCIAVLTKNKRVGVLDANGSRCIYSHAKGYANILQSLLGLFLKYDQLHGVVEVPYPLIAKSKVQRYASKK